MHSAEQDCEVVPWCTIPIILQALVANTFVSSWDTVVVDKLHFLQEAC